LLNRSTTPLPLEDHPTEEYLHIDGRSYCPKTCSTDQPLRYHWQIIHPKNISTSMAGPIVLKLAQMINHPTSLADHPCEEHLHIYGLSYCPKTYSNEQPLIHRWQIIHPKNIFTLMAGPICPQPSGGSENNVHSRALRLTPGSPATDGSQVQPSC